MTAAPWPTGAATGIGSMPGTDILEAVRTVFGELPDLPHLPELPARGAGADIIGRGAGLLVELPVEVVVSGWRLSRRPGLDSRRTTDLRERDLDALTEVAEDYRGPLKLQVAGPWTLAAGIELPTGERILSDRGAVEELIASLAEGVRVHLAQIRARVPGAEIVLQLDEPSLPAVLEGSLRSASGFRAHRPVDAPVAVNALATVLDAAPGEAARTLIHCCADDAPLALLAETGATAVSLDLTRMDLGSAKVLDTLGAYLDDGGCLVAGVVAATGDDPDTLPTVEVLAERLRTVWRQLGFAPELLPAAITVAPPCGLAGASVAYAKAALTRCREVGRRLAAEPE